MSSKLYARWKALESRLSVEWGGSIATPEQRRKAYWHFHLLDHGMLRALWANLSEIAPGAWRSNQPSPRGLRRLQKLGIKSVLNLRGVNQRSPYLFEQETCHELGMTLVSCNLSARSLMPRENLVALLDVFDTIEYPFVMHCKSGADRAGLASALYMLYVKGASIAEAKEQLSFRYLHIRSSVTGILDHVLDAYEKDNAENPMAIRDWIETRYDNEKLTAEFHQIRSKT